MLGFVQLGNVSAYRIGAGLSPMRQNPIQPGAEYVMVDDFVGMGGVNESYEVSGNCG